MRQLISFILLAFASIATFAEDRLLIAVASNFEHTLKQLSADFKQQHPNIDIVSSAAASGSHFQQIRHGAPFDIFLSADANYPAQLSQHGPVIDYAFGQLALASKRRLDINHLEGVELAIANPNTAPYGKAAEQFLLTLGIQHRGPRGNNVGQTLNFLASGAVEAAFVALSQQSQANQFIWQAIPNDRYQPIRQSAILLNDSPTSRLFWHYLQSAQAKAIIIANGYGTQ